MMTFTTVDSDPGELCVMAFEAVDAGVLGTITGAAVPTRWWAACADLDGLVTDEP